MSDMISEFWPGLCECGCGEVTPITTKTRVARGLTKGESARFISGHNGRSSANKDRLRELAIRRIGKPSPTRGRKWSQQQRVALSKRRIGHVLSPETRVRISEAQKGQPRPETTGEFNGQWKDEDAGYRSKHLWVNRHFPRSGICEHCQQQRRTHWANKGHTYRRVREDWMELCPSCHARFDGRGDSN